MDEEDALKNQEKQDLSRIQGFSDGVFAFAATLLVLSFSVPPHLSEQEMIKQVMEQGNQLASYIISFLIIGGFWYSHHQKFNYIKRYNQPFVWLNILILMSVCLVPFTTNLEGDYTGSVFVANIYSLNMILVSLLFGLLWFYATFKKRLTEKEISKQEIFDGYLLTIAVCTIFGLSILLSFIHVDFAQYAWFLTFLLPLVIKFKMRKRI